LKWLDGLWGFDFVDRWIFVDQWLRRINKEWINIVIGWWGEEITTTKIRKFRMLVSILMVPWVTQRGRWEGKMFTLYIFGKRRWNIKWIFNEWLVLFIVVWWPNIWRVLWLINSVCIRGWRHTCEIMDDRLTIDVRKEWRGIGREGFILCWVLMLKIPFILFMNDKACWLRNTNSVNWLFLVQTSEAYGMDEHKETTSRGTPWCKDRGRITQWIWEIEGLTTKYMWKLIEVMLGGCERWTSEWTWSSTSLDSGGFVWWMDGMQAIKIVTTSTLDCIAPSLKNVERGLISGFFLGWDDFLRKYSNGLKDRQISFGSSELETVSHGSTAKNQ